MNKFQFNKSMEKKKIGKIRTKSCMHYLGGKKVCSFRIFARCMRVTFGTSWRSHDFISILFSVNTTNTCARSRASSTVDIAVAIIIVFCFILLLLLLLQPFIFLVSCLWNPHLFSLSHSFQMNVGFYFTSADECIFFLVARYSIKPART